MNDLVILDPHMDESSGKTGERDDDRSSRSLRWVVWGVSVAVFAAFSTLGRVHTHLGVKAVAWDKDGREYVWRVWWRARDDIIDLNPAWVFSGFYVVMIVAFLGLSALAFWLALVPIDRDCQSVTSVDLAPRS